MAYIPVHTAYSYFLLLLGTVLFARALVRSPRLYRWQIVVLLFGAVAPWVGNAISIFNLGTTPNLDWSSLVFTVTGIAFTWGLFRFRLFDLVPIARERVIEDMRDGMLVLDKQNRIVDDNGPGIPVEIQGRLFQAFHRFDAETWQRPGTGLLPVGRRGVRWAYLGGKRTRLGNCFHVYAALRS